MQKVFPVSRTMKDFEKFLLTTYEMGIYLDIHISQLKYVKTMLREKNKKIFLHMDLIQGLRNDDHATEYICQEFKPAGIISTKASVILKARQKGLVAVQRVFLLDSQALEKNLKLIERTKPDFIEVLPGAMPWIIKEIKDRIDIPIIAGGFIRTIVEVENALQAGASAITTSNIGIWNHYQDLS